MKEFGPKGKGEKVQQPQQEKTTAVVSNPVEGSPVVPDVTPRTFVLDGGEYSPEIHWDSQFFPLPPRNSGY